MPVKSHQIEGGARVLVYTCEVCGAEANFGYHADPLKALRTKKPEYLGRWYCASHRPDQQGQSDADETDAMAAQAAAKG